MKKTPLIVFAVCAFGFSAFAQGPDESMHDAFAKGFQAVKNKNRDEAVQWFQKAGRWAVEAQDWRGALDAGNALLKLGEPGQAANQFDQALAMAQNRKKDWRIAVAAGYALASLPPDLDKRDSAAKAFLLAAESGKYGKDWIAMAEAAQGLVRLEDKSSAAQVLEDAKKIVAEIKSPKGAQALARLYEALGMAQESNELKLARESYLKFYEETPEGIKPPPGWSPVGESVAGPSVPGQEQQRMARESADRDIESKNQWIRQQREIEHEKEKAAQEASPYFYYPYGYSSYTVYQPWSWDLLIPWASHYSSYYAYSGGAYHYHHGSYTGFGFSYGYAGSDGFFGVSLHVHD